MEYKIVPVEGIHEGGELWVKGPNVMQGYMKIDKPAQVQPLDKGWYGTGDIVTLDAEGYIKIAGRAKRFAKIAGEMVSLPMVEELANKLWPDEMVAVVAVKDDKKGEQLVLVAQNKNLKLEDFTKFALEKGLPAIAVPKNMFVSDIPLLGSGKTDFPKLQNLVEAGLYSLN
jgi:acyl-[acyl-carrier-protein]-phospholipid O-acyltransferase/long-chain-fatty-acid--[acyl-carrier-protein] ligase